MSKGEMRAGLIYTVLLLIPLLLGCPSVDARPLNLRADVQQATDSTVVVTGYWAGTADEWDWRVVGMANGTVAAPPASVELPRDDTARDASFCVLGVNLRGAERAEGPEACAPFQIPPTPLLPPGEPTIDSLSIDTTTTTALFDSLRVFDLETFAYVDLDDPATGADSLRAAVFGMRNETPYLCALDDEQGEGWYEAQVRSDGVAYYPSRRSFSDTTCLPLVYDEMHEKIVQTVRGQEYDFPIGVSDSLYYQDPIRWWEVGEVVESLALAEVGRTDSTITYEASWDCHEKATSGYVVRAGANDGSWSYTDTIPPEACDSETAMRDAVLAFHERAASYRDCVSQGLCN